MVISVLMFLCMTVGNIILCSNGSDRMYKSSDILIHWFIANHLFCTINFECSRAALTFALLLFKTISITVMETTTLTIRAVASNPIDIMYATVFCPSCIRPLFLY